MWVGVMLEQRIPLAGAKLVLGALAIVALAAEDLHRSMQHQAADLTGSGFLLAAAVGLLACAAQVVVPTLLRDQPVLNYDPSVRA